MDNITQDIIERAMVGDEYAFELIYKAYFRFVSNVAYRIVTKQEEAEDVCQEVFITIYRKLKNFRQESSLKTWIYRITINCAVRYSMKKKNQQQGMVGYDEATSVAIQDENVRDAIDYKEKEKMVQELLNHLNLEQRICIVLRSIERLSYKEIAETLKVPINTVRSRIKRAREAMMAMRKEVIAHDYM